MAALCGSVKFVTCAVGLSYRSRKAIFYDISSHFSIIMKLERGFRVVLSVVGALTTGPVLKVPGFKTARTHNFPKTVSIHPAGMDTQLSSDPG